MTKQKLTDFFENYWGKEFLSGWAVKDEFMVNGLQVEGKETIKKVALGVSLNYEFLNQAVAWGADACVFHHAFKIDFPGQKLPLVFTRRLGLVLENKLNIYGFHGVMDGHPRFGHAALALKNLGAKIKGSIDDGWGAYGDLSRPTALASLSSSCRRFFNHEIAIAGAPLTKVRRIAVVSGGGSPTPALLADLLAKKVDLYLSGEIKEWLPHQFAEAGLAYFVCGHYATERPGVLALADALKKSFPSLGVKFIEVPNIF